MLEQGPVGTAGERTIAWIGIVGGVPFGLVPAIFAYVSYSEWQQGRASQPWIAWFMGCGIMASVLVGGVAGLFHIESVRPPFDPVVSAAAVVGFIAYGLLGSWLLARRARRREV